MFDVTDATRTDWQRK